MIHSMLYENRLALTFYEYIKAHSAKIAKLARTSLKQTRFYGCASPRKTTKFFRVTPKQDYSLH